MGFETKLKKWPDPKHLLKGWVYVMIEPAGSCTLTARGSAIALVFYHKKEKAYVHIRAVSNGATIADEHVKRLQGSNETEYARFIELLTEINATPPKKRKRAPLPLVVDGTPYLDGVYDSKESRNYDFCRRFLQLTRNLPKATRVCLSDAPLARADA